MCIFVYKKKCYTVDIVLLSYFFTDYHIFLSILFPGGMGHHHLSFQIIDNRFPNS